MELLFHIQLILLSLLEMLKRTADSRVMMMLKHRGFHSISEEGTVHSQGLLNRWAILLFFKEKETFIMKSNAKVFKDNMEGVGGH